MPCSSTGAWSGRSVFVTGAYGLLGSWLVKRLLGLGARLTVLRRDMVGSSALVLEGTECHVNVVHGDICDGALLERAIAEYEIDTVFPLEDFRAGLERLEARDVFGKLVIEL